VPIGVTQMSPRPLARQTSARLGRKRYPKAAFGTKEVFRALLQAVRTPTFGIAYGAAASLLAVGVLVVLEVSLERLEAPSRIPVGAILVGILFLQAFGGIRFTRFWRRWLPWHDARSEKLGTLLGETLASVALLTFFFAGLTSLIYVAGGSTSKPEINDAFVWRALEYYLWHFLDAIPALEIPATLNWSLSATFVDVSSGGLLLAYKLFVIVPIVRLIVDVIDARRSPTEARGQTPQ
jgi:hypothetical protein